MKERVGPSGLFSRSAFALTTVLCIAVGGAAASPSMAVAQQEGSERSSKWVNTSANWKWNPQNAAKCDPFWGGPDHCAILWSGSDIPETVTARVSVPEGCTELRIIAGLSGWAGIQAQPWWRANLRVRERASGEIVGSATIPPQEMKTLFQREVSPGKSLSLRIKVNTTFYSAVQFKSQLRCSR